MKKKILNCTMKISKILTHQTLNTRIDDICICIYIYIYIYIYSKIIYKIAINNLHYTMVPVVLIHKMN